MTPADPHEDRLAELRRRWEADPGSRLFLQLAEEYRRDGRREEALAVLRRGLETHPQQVSGLVSLGRLQLEMGRAGDAAGSLEKAVSIDPTNLVAMKLAVEANLEQGERDEARQRLELYKILNAGDPEIEVLEARLGGRPSEPPPAEPPPPAPAAEEAEAPAPAAGEWSATAAWPGLPTGTESVIARPPRETEPDAPRPDEPPPAPRAGEAGGAGGDGGRPEPFGDLAAHGERRRYLAGLAAEGIFQLELEPEPEPAPEPAPEPEPQPEPDAKAPWAAAAEPVWSDDDEGWQLDDEEAPAAPADAEERPTVTLGQLYLDQGHPGEALRIFEAVLTRDPEHAQARSGLLRAQGALARAEPAPVAPVGTSPPAAAVPEAVPPHAFTAASPVAAPAAAFTLTAAELLAGADPAQPPRQALLHAYLDRIRGRHGS